MAESSTIGKYLIQLYTIFWISSSIASYIYDITYALLGGCRIYITVYSYIRVLGPRAGVRAA